jgi:tetratricopeptide (TPR) repeat protein
VFHKLNSEGGEGEQLSEHYEIQGWPTFLLIDSQGQTIGRWGGFRNVEEFKRILEDNLSDPTTVEERMARFASDPTARDAEVLARVQASQGEYAEAVNLFREARKLAGGSGRDLAVDIFDSLFGGYYNEMFTAEEVRAGAEAVLASRSSSAADLIDMARIMAFVAKNEKDHDMAVPYLEAAMEASKKADAEALAGKDEKLDLAYLLFVKKDKDQALALKREMMPDDWMESADSLNEFASWCFEFEINLEEAETLASKGLELAEPGEEKAMVLDTLAGIVCARGNPGEAAELMEQACMEVPDDEAYLEQLHLYKEMATSDP